MLSAVERVGQHVHSWTHALPAAAEKPLVLAANIPDDENALSASYANDETRFLLCHQERAMLSLAASRINALRPRPAFVCGQPIPGPTLRTI